MQCPKRRNIYEIDGNHANQNNRNTAADSADVDITVTYHPLWLPVFLPAWHDSFHFVTAKSDDGLFVWLAKG